MNDRIHLALEWRGGGLGGGIEGGGSTGPCLRLGVREPAPETRAEGDARHITGCRVKGN